ncbi:MAG: hypothetical protein M1608_13215, partial [Candidatus Omnitrophica bacterium]|nr:hypothetical protein [Candidatus Omnitrophota bacterium]
MAAFSEFAHAPELRVDKPAAKGLRREVEAWIQGLPRHPSANALLDALVGWTVHSIHAPDCLVLLFDARRRAFIPRRSHPCRPLSGAPGLPIASPIVQYYTGIGAELPDAGGPGSTDAQMAGVYSNPVIGELAESLPKTAERFKPSACFPLISQQRLIGLWALGEVGGPMAYTAADLGWLAWAGRCAGLFLDRLVLVHGLELVGQMSQGLAHDVRSWLTPVATFLQLISDGPPHAEK